MKAKTITVRQAGRTIVLRAYVGADGVTVAEGGTEQTARKFWNRCHTAEMERQKPKPYSPFQPFRVNTKVPRRRL